MTGKRESGWEEGLNLMGRSGSNPLGCRPREQGYFYFVKVINRRCAPSSELVLTFLCKGSSVG